MVRYYVIPIIDSRVLIPYRLEKYIAISNYVEEYYPRLAELEEERISIIFSGNYTAPFTGKQKEKLKRNDLQKRQVAAKLGIPLYILATKEEQYAYEVVTHQKVLSYQNNPVFLDFREQPRNTFLTYYNSDYIQKVKRFMKRKDFTVIQGGLQKTLTR